MLERIGGECAGAVRLLPQGMQPPMVEHRLRPLAETELERIVNERPLRPLLVGEQGLLIARRVIPTGDNGPDASSALIETGEVCLDSCSLKGG
jgi:hypothetical protein